MSVICRLINPSELVPYVQAEAGEWVKFEYFPELQKGMDPLVSVGNLASVVEGLSRQNWVRHLLRDDLMTALKSKAPITLTEMGDCVMFAPEKGPQVAVPTKEAWIRRDEAMVRVAQISAMPIAEMLNESTGKGNRVFSMAQGNIYIPTSKGVIVYSIRDVVNELRKTHAALQRQKTG